MNLDLFSQVRSKPLPSYNVRTANRLFAFCGIGASITFFAGFLVVATLQTEYEPLADTVSRMARMGRIVL